MNYLIGKLSPKPRIYTLPEEQQHQKAEPNETPENDSIPPLLAYVLLFFCQLLLSSEWISLVEGVWVWACSESPLRGDATESMIILGKGS
jgi:hypothetical protein